MKKVFLVIVILIASLSLVSVKEYKDNIILEKADYSALGFNDAGGPPINGPITP